jgi:hypothetical protein
MERARRLCRPVLGMLRLWLTFGAAVAFAMMIALTALFLVTVWSGSHAPL